MFSATPINCRLNFPPAALVLQFEFNYDCSNLVPDRYILRTISLGSSEAVPAATGV